MTLILSLQCASYAVQLSDRRLSINPFGKVNVSIHDEWNKAGVLTTADGRLAYGYAGIAKFGSFDMRSWLRQQLLQCSAPDFLTVPTIARLATAATLEFRSSRFLRTISKYSESYISFSGFIYNAGRPRSVFAIVTNASSNVPLQKANGPGSFGYQIWYEELNTQVKYVSVQRIGNWPALKESQAIKFENMLREGLPSEAVRNKGFEVMKEISESSVAARTVGAQISAITIPSDRAAEFELGYRSNKNSRIIFSPDIIFAESAENRNWYTLTIENADPSIPTVVPKVPSKSPCPCGSGKRYKKCHGQNKNYR